MNGMLQKWIFPLLLTPLLFFIFLNQPDKRNNWSEANIMSVLQIKTSLADDRTEEKSGPCRAKIFYNKKGLKNCITIISPLRELTAIAKTETETIDELIEKISLYIPQIYYEQFLVSPKCIIILETKINDNNKAEIRFGVAMECTPKLQVLNTFNI
jgi:hypothetical protein